MNALNYKGVTPSDARASAASKTKTDELFALANASAESFSAQYGSSIITGMHISVCIGHQVLARLHVTGLVLL